MKNILFILLAVFLVGCSVKVPSIAIAESTKKEIVAIQDTIKNIEKTTPKECKTDVLLASLDSINKQVSLIGGQVDSISLACQTEKNVLEERITARNSIIFGMGILLAVLVFLFMKGKIK